MQSTTRKAAPLDRLPEKDLSVEPPDSGANQSRLGDANRIRKCHETGAPSGRSS